MYKFYLLLFVALTTNPCCQAWKVQDFDDDNWIDEDEVYGNVKYQQIQWIFPGTKWCGTGNIAANENDLGTAAETDACCREHDFCDDILEAGESKHNLTNESFYTKLNCRCDERFYDCLKSSPLKSSRAVGHIYFNVLGTQCYRHDYPIVKCVKYHSFAKSRCIEYKLNTNAPKVWQWFDVPPF